jgi:uncharacterized protein
VTLALARLPGLVFWRGLLALLWLLSAPVWAELAIPPVARVTDHAAVLTPGAIQAMEAELAALEAAKGSQIAVLILPTTQPETIEQYALRVAEAWKLGRKGVDDGVLLLVAKDDRALRIEVGYGLEGAIPDAVAKRVIEEVIVPHFKAGDFQRGIRAGVTTLIKLVQGEPLPPPTAPPRDPPLGKAFFMMLGLIILGSTLLRMLLGRVPGAAAAGGMSLVGQWALLGSLQAALVLAVMTFLVAVIEDRPGRRSRPGSGGWGGGGGFGGGGGGFSGGGGGFGGGGASGRW